MTWVRRLLVAAGVLVMAYAAYGAWTAEGRGIGRHLVFLGAVLVAHDGIVLPAAIGVGVLIGRLVPATARAVVRGAAYVSAILTVVALPFMLGYGRLADEPSALPLDYGHGLLVCLAAVWTVALTTIAVRHHYRQRSTP